MFTLRALKRLMMVAALACLAQAPLSHAALLSLDSGSATAGNGESLSLDLLVSGLGAFAPDSLGAFDVDVGFDDTVLAFTGYTLGGFLGDISLLEAIDVSGGASGGVVDLAQVSLLAAASLDALQPGEFILATLTFDVIDLAAGAATVLSLLPDAILADADGVRLPATAGNPVTIVGRTPVPVSGTLLLMLAGVCSWRLVRHTGQRTH